MKLQRIGWVNIDFELTRTEAIPGQLYLLGYSNKEDQTTHSSIKVSAIGAKYPRYYIKPLRSGPRKCIYLYG